MDLGSLGQNAFTPEAEETSMALVIAILQSLVDHESTPEPEMLTNEYKDRLENYIAQHLESGQFSRAQDLVIRLNLVEMAITQTYADMDAGVKEKLDWALQAADSSGKPLNRLFLQRAAQRYQRIIDRMDLDSQSGSPALIEYLNIYATVLDLLGDFEQARRVNDRIPTAMLAMLDQQKTRAAKFCLAERGYWDRQVEAIDAEPVLTREHLQTLKKALRFYERNEAVLCAVTREHGTIGATIEMLRGLCGSQQRVA